MTKLANYQLVFADGTPNMDVLPTPRLLAEGSGGRFVEAYEQAAESDEYPAVWRVREDSYDPEGTEYSKVRVIPLRSYYVQLDVEIVDPSDEFTDELPERFSLHVRAADARIAQDMAAEDARAQMREWAGDVSTIVTFIHLEELD